MDCGCDLRFEFFELRGGGEGADLSVFACGVADFEVVHGGDEAGFKFFVDGFGDEEALGGDAGLPLSTERAATARDGGVERGRGHDDEGIAAAEFEDGFLDEPSGLGGDGAAGGLAASDRDGGDALIGEHHLDLAGFDEERLEAAAGKAGAADEGLDGERALGDVGGVLEQAHVASHQGGREEAEDLPEGEVPGHDGEDDSERVPADGGVEGRGVERLRREDAGGVCGVEAAGGGALGDFSAGLRDGLAHLGGDERGEVCGLAVQKVRELVHAERAMGERDLRCAGECGLGESDLFQQGLAGERREAAQQNSGGGIDGLDGHGLTQRQAYQERRARGEERSLRAIAPSMPGLKIESWGNRNELLIS